MGSKLKIIGIIVILTLLGGVSFLFLKNNSTLNKDSNSGIRESNITDNSNKKEKLEKNSEFSGLIIIKDGKKYFDTMYGLVSFKEISKYSKKYGTLNEFLNDANKLVRNITGLHLDLTKDDFVICVKSGDIIKRVVKFNHKKLEQGMYDIPGLKYKYMYDIKKSIENNCIAGGAKSNAGYKILLEEDLTHPLNNYVENILERKTNVFNLIKELEGLSKMDKEHKQLLGFLYDFIGDYDKANKIQGNIYKKSSLVILKGKMLDQDNKPLSGVKLTLLKDPSIYTISDEDGKFTLKFKSFPFTYLRFRAHKFGYSDGYFSFKLDFSQKPNLKKWYIKNFHLTKSPYAVKLNWGKKKPDKIFASGKYYIFKTRQSTYYVPIDGLHYKDGRQFKAGEVYVFMYEFRKRDKIEDVVNVDTFAPVAGYVGNLMKTFGMPYIQFFDGKGRELFVYKSNPMLVENKIYHMKELYTAYDKIYPAVTKEDMQYLYNYSRTHKGYPITYYWLIKNNFLKWPCWWVLDRKKGTWIDIPHKVVDPSGIVRFEFWEIDDTK